MRKETSNTIRWVMEDWVPPALRDTFLFRKMMELVYGGVVSEFAKFRKNAHYLTEKEYMDFYAQCPRIHELTDNSKAVLDAIMAHVLPESVCDVGCGTGYTLGFLQERLPECTFTGIDVVVSEATRQSLPHVHFQEGSIEKLPFRDGEFDTVICTHTLEHILDIRAAVAELRRIAAKRLIIVVPREREALYTFNPHFHFFPYSHSFLRVMTPLPKKHLCSDIQRDLFYYEDKE